MQAGAGRRDPLLDRPVADVMTPVTWWLALDATVGQAVRALARTGARSAPVLDATGRPAGQVSSGGLLAWLAAGVARGSTIGSLCERPLRAAMDVPVRCAPGTTVAELGWRLVQQGARGALVVDRGALVGVVALEELAGPPGDDEEALRLLGLLAA